MNTIEANDVATIIVGVTCAAFLGYTITYASRSHFWESWLGYVMFVLGVDGVVITGHVLVRRVLGDYPGYEWVAVGIYTFTAITAIALWFIITAETRRKPMLMVPLKSTRKVKS